MMKCVSLCILVVSCSLYMTMASDSVKGENRKGEDLPKRTPMVLPLKNLDTHGQNEHTKPSIAATNNQEKLRKKILVLPKPSVRTKKELKPTISIPTEKTQHHHTKEKQQPQLINHKIIPQNFGKVLETKIKMAKLPIISKQNKPTPPIQETEQLTIAKDLPKKEETKKYPHVPKIDKNIVTSTDTPLQNRVTQLINKEPKELISNESADLIKNNSPDAQILDQKDTHTQEHTNTKTPIEVMTANKISKRKNNAKDETKPPVYKDKVNTMLPAPKKVDSDSQQSKSEIIMKHKEIKKPKIEDTEQTDESTSLNVLNKADKEEKINPGVVADPVKTVKPKDRSKTLGSSPIHHEHKSSTPKTNKSDKPISTKNSKELNTKVEDHKNVGVVSTKHTPKPLAEDKVPHEETKGSHPIIAPSSKTSKPNKNENIKSSQTMNGEVKDIDHKKVVVGSSKPNSKLEDKDQVVHKEKDAIHPLPRSPKASNPDKKIDSKSSEEIITQVNDIDHKKVVIISPKSKPKLEDKDAVVHKNTEESHPLIPNTSKVSIPDKKIDSKSSQDLNTKVKDIYHKKDVIISPKSKPKLEDKETEESQPLIPSTSKVSIPDKKIDTKSSQDLNTKAKDIAHKKEVVISNQPNRKSEDKDPGAREEKEGNHPQKPQPQQPTIDTDTEPKQVLQVSGEPKKKEELEIVQEIKNIKLTDEHKLTISERIRNNHETVIIAVCLTLIISTILLTVVGVQFRKISLERRRYIGHRLLESADEDELPLFNRDTYNGHQDTDYTSWESYKG